MVFVPEGQHDSSQARSAWVAMQKGLRPGGTVEVICRPTESGPMIQPLFARLQSSRWDEAYFPHNSRHFVPGYYRAAPPGQNTLQSTERSLPPIISDFQGARIASFPQPAAQDKSGAQSHEHRFGWVLLNIGANFRLPRFRARLGIRPCIFHYMLELRGRCFRR
jgi:hypothetical protein